MRRIRTIPSSLARCGEQMRMIFETSKARKLNIEKFIIEALQSADNALCMFV